MLFAVLTYVPKTYANQANIQNNNKYSFANRPLDRNDPELIAFYEQLFGKSEKKPVTPAQKPLTKHKTPIPSSRVLKPSLTNSDKKTENQVKQQVAEVSSTSEPIKRQNLLANSATNSNSAFFQQRISDHSKTDDDSEKKVSGSSTDLSALFAKAFGKKAVKSPSEVTVELRVNKATLGEVKLFSNQNGVIDRAETEALLLLLKEALKEHVFVRFTDKLAKDKKTTFSLLDELGVSAVYNPTNLSLDLEIPSELRKPQVLSMLSKKKASVREENKVKAQDLSAFANFYSNVGFDSANSSNADLKIKLEGSVNIGGKVFESIVDYRNEGFGLGRTTLTYDKPDKLQRVILGNISTGSRNFQENLELDGIRISKEFFMDPELQIRPKSNESFVLEN